MPELQLIRRFKQILETNEYIGYNYKFGRNTKNYGDIEFESTEEEFCHRGKKPSF
jgi:hypothetical protein